MTYSPQNGHQYQAAFDKHVQNFTAAQLGDPLEYGQACYDATWILALALNNTLTGMHNMIPHTQYIWSINKTCYSTLYCQS